MAILGEDNRSIVTNFNEKGIDAVVTIDYPINISDEEETSIKSNGGTGNLISPYHVLTAGHVIFDQPQAKVRLGENASTLSSRTRTPLSPEDFNASSSNFSYPAPGYDGSNNGGIGGKDLALITLDEQIGEPSQYVGLAVCINPKDAKDLEVTTAGFPGTVKKTDFSTNEDESINIQESISKNAQFLITDENNVPSESFLRATGFFYFTDAVKMFTATGTIDSVNSDGEFSLDKKVDTEPGQSGSGFWTFLEGNYNPLVVGVLSFSGLPVQLIQDNYGALITTEAYDNIVATMKPLLNRNNITGNDLPENAIIGSEPGSFGLSGGNDEIVGTYRRERILGRKGDDILSGEGADDRLEGGEGDDQLTGGAGNDQLDGGTNPPTLNPLDNEEENDVAIFSGNMIEYQIDIETTGGIIVTPIGEETITTITHLNGGIDGVDTLTNIEFVQFKDRAISRPFDLSNPDPAKLTGGTGNDTLEGNILNNIIFGDLGNDLLKGLGGNDTARGGEGNDTLDGGIDDDVLYGQADNDRVVGDIGNDKLFGDLGNDTIAGGAGNDILNGGSGNDTLYAQADNDRVFGLNGNDRLLGDLGNDTVAGGAGNDLLNG